ncbi:cytochrome P450 [Nocardia sp. NPDC050175]|uniref:cytochrome P450 n=1 Tax=Nocardia sp. NPDC050175 TaxID=3364317 RepID=UPI0037A8241F
MTGTVEKVVEDIRERVVPFTAFPLPRAVDERWLHHRWPVREFAAVPDGIGLEPIRGDAGMPVLGHSLEMLRFGRAAMLRQYDEYGPVSWTSIFGRRVIILSGPDATQAALVNKGKAFSTEGWKFFMEKFFERGIMLMDFGEHRLHRRILQQAFTPDRLAGYVAEFGPTLRDGVTAWSAKPSVRLYWALKHLTLDVANNAFTGRVAGADATRINRAFVDAVRGGTAIVRFPVPGGRWARGINGRKILERHFAAMLPEKRAVASADLCSILCHAVGDDGERFTDTDVINHMIFLMMAAHDTSTIASTAAAFYLAEHPEWQERARAESLLLGDELPDIDALDRLETLDLVIKEALRLVAPIPSLARMTVQDTEVLGHSLPAGALVAINPQPNHFDARYWTDPFTFDPERFSEQRREDKSHRYAWMPFGGGAHKCIGMFFGILEVKALLHEMLRTYRWSVPAGYAPHWHAGPVPVPLDGLPVRLERLG